MDITDIRLEIRSVEQGQDPGEPTSPDIREGNKQDDSKRPPLGVPLTGYLLFTISWILGLLVPKAVYSYRGQTVIPTTLDWVGGIVFAFISLGLGEIKDKRPELFPRFFEVDLAPCILEFLCRNDVLVWFSFVLPFLLAMEGMSFMEHSKRQVAKYATTSEVAQFSKGPTQFVFGVSVVVFLFCLQGLRALWPKGFEGNRYYIFSISTVMVVAHMQFMGVIQSDSTFVHIMNLMTMRLYMWMAVGFSWRPSEREHEGFFSRHFPFLQHITPYSDAIVIVILVIWEVTVMNIPEMPKVPALYSSLFFCGSLVSVRRRFSAIIPPSWVSWFTWEAAYNRVRSAGSKASEYAMGIHRKVRSARWEAWVSVRDIYDRIRGTGS